MISRLISRNAKSLPTYSHKLAKVWFLIGFDASVNTVTHREFFDCATTNLLRQSAIPFKLSLEINDFYSTFFFCNSDKHEFKVFLILSSEQYLITCYIRLEFKNANS